MSNWASRLPSAPAHSTIRPPRPSMDARYAYAAAVPRSRSRCRHTIAASSRIVLSVHRKSTPRRAIVKHSAEKTHKRYSRRDYSLILLNTPSTWSVRCSVLQSSFASSCTMIHIHSKPPCRRSSYVSTPAKGNTSSKSIHACTLAWIALA